MPVLTRAQASAIPVLEWMLDPELRGYGRTTALAIAVIRVAAVNPRVPIHLVDPWGAGSPRAMSEILVDMVINFVESDAILGQTYDRGLLRRGNGALRFDMMRPIHNWLPRGWNSPIRLSPVPNEPPQQRPDWAWLADPPPTLTSRMIDVERTVLGFDFDAETLAMIAMRGLTVDRTALGAFVDPGIPRDDDPRFANETANQSPAQPAPVRTLWDHLDEGS